VDAAFRRQVTEALTAARFDVTETSDVIGVELAGCAADAAALAAATAGPSASASAAGKLFAEVESYARLAGARPGTLSGLAGTGELISALLAADAVDASSVPLLAERVRSAGLDAPVLRGLANVVEGKVAQERWTASLTAPRPLAVREKVRAA